MEDEQNVVKLIEEMIDLKLAERINPQDPRKQQPSNEHFDSDRLESLRVALATAIQRLFRNI